MIKIKRLIIDAHLDVGMNALRYNRDQLKSVEEIRAREVRLKGYTGQKWLIPQKSRGVNTVSLPDLRAGNICISFVTTVSRIGHETNNYEGYDGREICYAGAMGQYAYYRILEDQGHVRILKDWASVKSHVDEWEQAGEGDAPPIGFIFTMEGADPIVSPEQVPEWWERGLRAVGLSHYGKSSYAHGTGCEGGLTELAPPLLAALEEVGMIIDLTHLADQSFWEVLERFSGRVIASHNNCRSLVPGDRQFSDEQIGAIVERDGVIGVAMDAWMLQPGWTKGIYNQVTATLETVVDHIDHICQLAGNAGHVAIGTDLDGGFGKEQSPKDLETIADLQKLPSLLQKRGYSDGDIDGILHGNWLRFLREAWGE